MHRFLVSPEAVQGDALIIRELAVIHHLQRVLRIRAGEAVECFDGKGNVYRGLVQRVVRGEVVIAVSDCLQPPQDAVRISLAQALIGPKPFEWALQKATELGVHTIIPMLTSRTTIRYAGKADKARSVRWQRIVQAASAQSKHSTVPVVEPVQLFDRLIASKEERYGLLCAPLKDALPLRECLPLLPRAGDILLLIGPEGDFTPEEIQEAKRAGFHIVQLGHAVLRAETASLVALSLLQTALQQL